MTHRHSAISPDCASPISSATSAPTLSRWQGLARRWADSTSHRARSQSQEISPTALVMRSGSSKRTPMTPWMRWGWLRPRVLDRRHRRLAALDEALGAARCDVSLTPSGTPTSGASPSVENARWCYLANTTVSVAVTIYRRGTDARSMAGGRARLSGCRSSRHALTAASGSVTGGAPVARQSQADFLPGCRPCPGSGIPDRVVRFVVPDDQRPPERCECFARLVEIAPWDVVVAGVGGSCGGPTGRRGRERRRPDGMA
jgi:hypothetical protein